MIYYILLSFRNLVRKLLIDKYMNEICLINPWFCLKKIIIRKCSIWFYINSDVFYTGRMIYTVVFISYLLIHLQLELRNPEDKVGMLAQLWFRTFSPLFLLWFVYDSNSTLHFQISVYKKKQRKRPSQKNPVRSNQRHWN